MKPLPVLKRNLWKIFSEYIRRRDSDSEGFGRCISCGAVGYYKEMHAGHYIPKSLGLSIYFEEKNVHMQCPGCNLYRHGHLSSYAVNLRKKYGESILEELDQIKNNPVKFSRDQYEDLIELYKEKLNAL